MDISDIERSSAEDARELKKTGTTYFSAQQDSHLVLLTSEN